MVADLLHDRTGGPRRDARQPFVGMLANGCFGDINNIDVHRPLRQRFEYQQIFEVAETVAGSIHAAWRDIRYHNWVPLAAQETTLDLAIRRPSAAEVAASATGTSLDSAPSAWSRAAARNPASHASVCSLVRE